jgi:O-succinylbenzoic acid--CoA ligase
MLLLNPKLQAGLKRAAQKTWSRFFEKHTKTSRPLGLLTSGSQGDPKIVIHSFESIMNSAYSVSQVFKIGPSDALALALPSFHAGGLGILARSYASGAPFFELPRWSVKDFLGLINQHQLSLTSLVPTQIFDLAKAKRRCPKSIRLVFVGGESLSLDLDQQMTELGWPLIKTYGLTETASMIAVSYDKKVERFYKLLPHCEARLSRSGLIEIKSSSLALGTLSLSGHFTRILSRGFWQSQDRGELMFENGQTHLKILGRQSDFLKILGEQVHWQRLEAELQSMDDFDVMLCPVQHARLGFELIVCVADRRHLAGLAELCQAWNKNRPAFERLAALCWIKAIPRSELGKVQRAELAQVVAGVRHRWQRVQP